MSTAAAPHRLGQLLGMRVLSATGEPLGQVNDVRVRARSGTAGYGGLVVDGLVVAQHDTGSLLGYDRRPQQGPALIRAIVAYLHRRAGYVTWGGVHTVDWDKRQVLLNVETLEDLKEP
jgi:sporulation protein YlmC with PRC-barrel domain